MPWVIVWSSKELEKLQKLNKHMRMHAQYPICWVLWPKHNQKHGEKQRHDEIGHGRATGAEKLAKKGQRFGTGVPCHVARLCHVAWGGRATGDFSRADDFFSVGGQGFLQCKFLEGG